MTDTNLPVDNSNPAQVVQETIEPPSQPIRPNLITGKNMVKLGVEMVKTLALIAVIVIGVNFFSQRIRVTGDSMIPNFKDGEIGLVNKVSFSDKEITWGDVIVFMRPATMSEPSKELIKRVIGLPGDKIEIRDDGIVYLNGSALSEPYVKQEPLIGTGSWVIGKDEIFVMGDNRNGSQDSRHWGPLKVDAIIGKVTVIYWPIGSFRSVTGWDYTTGKPK